MSASPQDLRAAGPPAAPRSRRMPRHPNPTPDVTPAQAGVHPEIAQRALRAETPQDGSMNVSRNSALPGPAAPEFRPSPE
jgi:hypothetical protein